MVRFGEHQRFECISNDLDPQIFLLLLLFALIVLVFLLLFVFLILGRLAVFREVSVLLLDPNSEVLGLEVVRYEAFGFLLQKHVALLNLRQAQEINLRGRSLLILYCFVEVVCHSFFVFLVLKDYSRRHASFQR